MTLSFDEIYTAAAGAMVYFEGRLEDGSHAAGAGFHIGNGTVLTARHVVEDLVSWRIWHDDPLTPNLDTEEVAFGAVELDPTSDLALVQTALVGPSLTILDPAIALPHPQQDLLILGYPRLGLTTEPILGSARDHISVVIPARKDIYGTHSLVLGRAHPPGFSGGPVLLTNGLVAGVVSVGRMVDETVELSSCVACTHITDFVRGASIAKM